MALPIPIVVDNFADYYSEQKKIEAKELKKEAQAKQAEFDVDAEKVRLFVNFWLRKKFRIDKKSIFL